MHRCTRGGAPRVWAVLWLERWRGWEAKGPYRLTYFVAVAPLGLLGGEMPTKYVKLPPLLVVQVRGGPRPIDRFPPKEDDRSLEGTRTLPAIFTAFFPIAAGGPFTCHHLRAKCGILQLWLMVAGRSLRSTRALFTVRSLYSVPRTEHRSYDFHVCLRPRPAASFTSPLHPRHFSSLHSRIAQAHFHSRPATALCGCHR